MSFHETSDKKPFSSTGFQKPVIRELSSISHKAGVAKDDSRYYNARPSLSLIRASSWGESGVA